MKGRLSQATPSTFNQNLNYESTNIITFLFHVKSMVISFIFFNNLPMQHGICFYFCLENFKSEKICLRGCR